ncbi:MAG TPA: DUF2304 domain-containing protein [Nocardioides sp.]|jgi:hypothetical protein|uniref:DUF2304 domain-containing protein n=1 Tax=Nocardioides sp. TaxID=35761 RepID=UPI002B7D1C8E|nr:DUF2304 domain-containing protein [Nocardioides sp.]HTW17957.1 DUF2304 domain-containing protein [Nocardioides sp.]
MSPEIFAGLVAVLVVALVLRLVASRRLLVKYAVLWLVVSVTLAVMAIIPDSVEALSDLAGFEVPSNFLFFAALGLLLCVNLQVSRELTTVERQLQRLAEEIAILREKQDGAG